MNRYILEQLHHLLRCNVIGDKQYDSRYKGFHGELDFSQWFAKNRQENNFYKGGYLIPRYSKDDTLEKPVYVTISSIKPDNNYRNIYRQIAKISPLQFYIYFNSSEEITNWKKVDVMGHGIDLPVPDLHILQFDQITKTFKESSLNDFLSCFKKKSFRNKNTYPITTETRQKHINKLEQHTGKDLLNLYVERLIFDGFIGFGRTHGIPSDIDAIIKKNDSFLFLEIKEKDQSKRHPRGFGMDCRRIESLLTIEKKTSIPYFYLVREIDDQENRNFRTWKVISMKKFSGIVHSGKVIEGGTGMRSAHSSNPTKVCPYDHFKNLA